MRYDAGMSRPLPAVALALALGLAPCVLTACSETQRSTSLETQPSAAPAGTLPTPFTADQIRDTNPPGTTLRFRLSAPDQPDL